MTTPKKRPHWVPVATGILRKRDEVLLGVRPNDGSLAGFWEFPGGKIEQNESPQEALKRELKEELGIEAEIGDLLTAATHFYGSTGIILLIYHVNFWKGEPKTKQHTELKWVPIKDVHTFALPEANKIIWPQLKVMLEKLK